jgi:heme-degrading monooxygenase HmoA
MKLHYVVLIRHKVGNYKKWRMVFDARGAVRKTHGCKGGHLFRSADNHRELVLLLEWSDLEKARQFIASDDAREAMARAGVSDMPDVYFLRQVDTAAA